VRRNTGTSGDLVVTLVSDDTTEATVPATVTIPDGQDSATFTVTGVLDGVNDGTRPVTILASAAGFNSGSAGLQVTDRDLPDLQITAIQLPASVKTGEVVTAQYTVTNRGLAAATGNWVDRVYISGDMALSSDDVLVATHAGEALAVGQSYQRVVNFIAGNGTGTVYMIVVTDPNGALEELVSGNNTAIESTVVTPAYRATVSAAVEQAPAGTPIELTGRAFDVETDEGVAFEPVTVTVTSASGHRRTLRSFTDALGNFSVNFVPLGQEAGRYTIAADHPGVLDRTAQDSFVLLGLRAENFPPSLDLLPNQPKSFTFDLRNLADVPLSGAQIALAGKPDWLDVDITLPSAIGADGVVQGRIEITANLDQETTSGRLVFTITTEEGAALTVPLNIAVRPLTARLVASPGYLLAGMLRDTQTLVSYTVTNNGGAATGPMTLKLPDVPWLSSLTPTSIGSLDVGESTTVTLRLNPPGDLPLGPYRGNIVLNAANASLSTAFEFRAISEARGDVRIRVEDEYTYFAEGNPGVADARVTLRDPYTLEVIATGLSDADGYVNFTDIAEGQYLFSCAADRHSNLESPITVAPGVLNETTAFLRRQVVTYQWNVVPIEIKDEYRIVLETVFETDVPMPVVVTDTPRLMPLILPGETTHMEITLTNVGLIQAENLHLRVPQNDPDLIITPLIDVIGVLPAKSSVTIPITIRMREDSPLLAAR
jgi:hypothetical protein